MKNATVFSSGILGLAFLLPLLAPKPAEGPEAGKYKLDDVHSTAIFAVKHLNTSIFRGGFAAIEGDLTIDKNIESSSISVTIETDSVNTLNAKRDQHLKSPDFFNAKEFPKITFKSTKIKSAGEGMLEITGDLSLHGVTKSVTAHATAIGAGKDPWGGFRVGYDTNLKIKRSDFGMKKMLDSIGDEVEILFSIEAEKAK